MKRIIDGATYNTETATLVATGSSEAGQEVTETQLFQNRAGVYFYVDEVKLTYKNRREEWQERVTHEWGVIGDAAKARSVCEQHGLTIVRDIEDMPPEAEIGEKMATIYARVPPLLKSELDQASTEDKMSGNQLVTRCIEKCLNIRDGRALKDLSLIWSIASTFSSHADGKWSREKCIEALSEIAELSHNLADNLSGQKDMQADMSVYFHDELSFRMAKENYEPY